MLQGVVVFVEGVAANFFSNDTRHSSSDKCETRTKAFFATAAAHEFLSRRARLRVCVLVCVCLRYTFCRTLCLLRRIKRERRHTNTRAHTHQLALVHHWPHEPRLPPPLGIYKFVICQLRSVRGGH